MRITAIDHVQLAMPAGGESDARAFYQGVLGIPEVSKPSHLGSRKAHPALLVEDLATLKIAVEAAGFTLRNDQPLEGYDRVYVDDPFGNRIELLEVQHPLGPGL